MPRSNQKNRIFTPKRMALNAILTAIALIIFVVELQIPSPVPIPGIKLGLANIITLVAMFELGPIDALLILILRIALGGIFSGRIVSVLYSLAGGLLCYVITLVLRKVVTKQQLWVASVFGAVAHNIGQIAVAVIITQTPAVASYLPILTVSGILTGLFTGLAATFISKRTTDFFKRFRENT